MSKSTHFSGQPLYSHIIRLLDKTKILKTSKKLVEERYIQRFDCLTHTVAIFYAVIMRFDSLHEITASLQVKARK